jgi:hypothetical protein
MAFGRFGLFAAAALSLWTGGPAWAGQRDANLFQGPMTEPPIILASCTAAEFALCPWVHSMRSEVRVAEMTLSGSRRSG